MVAGTGKRDELDPLERMRSRLDTTEGRALYARRKAVVEPVNGRSKHARRFRLLSRARH